MKKRNKHVFLRSCILIGVCLLVAGIMILLFWQWNIHSAMKKSESYVRTIRTLIPDSQGAVPENRNDNTMPILSVDETDFVGILEMPQYESTLPVCAKWGAVTKYPCQFRGSIYDGTMKIGATSQKGQYDFYRDISVGDTVLFTDMEGNCYTYAVTQLRYEKHADSKTLNSEASSLTLFIKNEYDFEYLIISCDTAY